MRSDDGLLSGGTANAGRVVRVGNRVHRPSGAHTEAVHALLQHVRAAGFDRAPVPLGVHDGRDVLGYIDGAAALDPLADWALADTTIAAVGALLRRYHNAARGFDGSGLRWQRAVPRAWRGALVTHNDLHPANVLFRAGRPHAMIDFDLAAPGTPAFDLAVTACFWAPLRDLADIADSRRDRVLRRFRLLLDGYGADDALRCAAVEATPAANGWIADVIADNARLGHPAFGCLWTRAHGMHVRASAWLRSHSDDLAGVSR